LPRSADGRPPLASRRVRLAAVALALAAGAAGLWAGGLRGPLSAALKSPETQAREAAAALSAIRALDAGPARVELDDLRLAEITVAVDGARARVVAIAEAGGRARFADQAPALAYVGRETFLLERCARGWCPVEGALPALRGVVAALAGSPRPPGARVLAWQIRVERDAATAGEDRELAAGGAPPRRLREVRALRRDAGGTWALVAP
jgi:hypothetical protein